MATKYIFISGGVISGLGKGITTSSIALLLRSRGLKVSPMKIDMYLNVDAGTIRPQEHGEVFVTDDGIETDQDIGNYERFLNSSLTRVNYLTTGQVYSEVLRKERAFEYNGEDVEAIPHITDEIIRRIKAAVKMKNGKFADVVLIELGGTVGEYQNAIFFEASRILRLRHPGDVLQIHVAYLPIPGYLGEMKSKPVQQSVRIMNSMGIQPDIIIGRAERAIDRKRKERIALFCNVAEQDVISNHDVKSIYEVPLILENQHLTERILEKFRLRGKKQDLREWKLFTSLIARAKRPVKIGVVGKYFTTGNFMLSDVYISVLEAIKVAAWWNKAQPQISWIDADEVEKRGVGALKGYDGIVVPGGFGKRGIEGIIRTIQFAREQKVPYFGLCYGLQLATIEFARHVAKLKGAHTTEVDEDTPHPVIHIMPEQEKKLLIRAYGATMRLGAWACQLKKGTQAYAAYGTQNISERHRHRYEVNNAYRARLEKAGLIISGTTPDGRLVEVIEIKNHPFFVGTQFHPELKSRPLNPHPLFREFIRAALARAR
ncbi:CTP synthase [Candidatus Uhrbacteria bacterium]|nr:CTP synthase [Candidatus Uhrbacteria bacterium]